MNCLILLAAVPDIDKAMNLWDMIVKGGWLMIPIFLLSVLGIYIMCERYMAIRKATKIPVHLTEKVINYIQNKHSSAALAECNATPTPLARMLHKGVMFSHLPASELRISMENTASAEISVLEKGLPILATVAGLAPMIGFLGTVVGMVQAFYDMSLAGNNINITLLSRGIYTAMITTVAGLIVGIIAYFGYNALVARINNVANQLENACSEFIDSLYEARKK